MNEKEIIMTNLDTVEDVIELVPAKPKVNVATVGIAVLAIGVAAALGYKAVKAIKAKKAKKAQEAEDFVTVEDNDFGVE